MRMKFETILFEQGKNEKKEGVLEDKPEMT